MHNIMHNLNMSKKNVININTTICIYILNNLPINNSHILIVYIQN